MMVATIRASGAEVNKKEKASFIQKRMDCRRGDFTITSLFNSMIHCRM
jgi:hypothetical protein